MTRRPKDINIHQAITKARRGFGLSITGLAQHTGYSLQHLSRVENGHAPPTENLVENVSNVLGEPSLLVLFWQLRVREATDELKSAREALKRARAATLAG
jgi:transcriptional regulator with XRE-family HTH domain